MSWLVLSAMIGWIPITMGFFAALGPQRGAIVAIIGGWLFLPEGHFEIAGLPDYTKLTAISCSVLLAAALFDGQRLAAVRPHWIDLPIAVWVMTPVASALANGLGLYDGFAGMAGQILRWGVPYFIGRAYFSHAAGLRELAIGVFLGGLAYVPLCLWEIRMSPQLNGWLYGFSPSSWSNALRLGGYRPKVFLHSGLPLGLWMTGASLVGAWLWHTGALRNLWGRRTGWAVATLWVTTFLCKSLGALTVLGAAAGVLYLCGRCGIRSAFIVWVSVTAVYIFGRTMMDWSGERVVAAAQMISADRAASLDFRILNENLLMARAGERPLLGWGAWGRNRPKETRTVTDGAWIIALGRYGLVGLVSMLGTLLVPAMWLWWKIRRERWSDPALAPVIVLSMLGVCLANDFILNAMLNPVFLVATGAVSGWLTTKRRLVVVSADRQTEDATRVWQGERRVSCSTGDGISVMERG